VVENNKTHLHLLFLNRQNNLHPAASKKIKVAFITNNALDFWKIAKQNKKKQQENNAGCYMFINPFIFNSLKR
jgi:hypothetical protein